jgi:hypothetical protein
MCKKNYWVIKKNKSKEQSYFNGIFFEASGKNKTIEIEDSNEETEDKKKNFFICYQCNNIIKKKIIALNKSVIYTVERRLSALIGTERVAYNRFVQIIK